MTERVESNSGGFGEKLLLLKRLFKGDKVIWVLFLLLNMVEVCSSPAILNHGNIMLAAMRGTMALTLCVVMTILVVNIHYSYFKVVVPLVGIAGCMLIDDITVKQFSPIALIESVLCISILVRTAMLSRRCREVFPSVLAMGIASLMVMQAIFTVDIPGMSVILNSLFIGIILSASRNVLQKKLFLPAASLATQKGLLE